MTMRYNDWRSATHRVIHAAPVAPTSYDFASAGWQQNTPDIENLSDSQELHDPGYLILNRRGHILESDLAAADMLCRPLQSLSGYPFSACLEAGQSGHLFAYLRQVFADHQSDQSDLTLELSIKVPRQSTAGRRLLLSRCSVQQQGHDADASDGEFCCIALSHVTDQTDTDGPVSSPISNQASQPDGLYELMLNELEQGVLLIDQQGQIEWVNQYYCQLCDCEAGQLIGRNILDLEVISGTEKLSQCLATLHRLGNSRLETIHRASTEVHPTEMRLSYLASVDRIVIFVRDLSQQRRLEGEIVNVQSRLQERLGHELHDGVGQRLTGLTMLASSLQLSLQDLELQAESASLGLFLEVLKETLQEIRLLARGLSPLQIGAGSMNDALGLLMKQVRSTTGIDCVLRNQTDLELIDSELVLQVYRVIQEAVQNAVKHANARKIRVRLAIQDTKLCVRVCDDGTGFDNGQIPVNQGLGLNLIRYRTQLLSGQCQFLRAEEGGACVQTEWPLLDPGSE